MPRCKTKDTDESVFNPGDSRCPNCEMWDAIDEYVKGIEDKGRLKEAQYWLKKAIKVLEEIDDPRDISIAYWGVEREKYLKRRLEEK